MDKFKIWDSRINVKEWEGYIKDELIPQYYERQLEQTREMIASFPLDDSKLESMRQALDVRVDNLDWSKIDYDDFVDENLGFIFNCIEEVNFDGLGNVKQNLQDIAENNIVLVSENHSWDGTRYGSWIMDTNCISDLLCAHTANVNDSEFYVEYDNGIMELKSTDFHHDGANHHTYRELKPDLSEEEIAGFVSMCANGIPARQEYKEVLDRYTTPLGEKVQKVYGFALDKPKEREAGERE